jgi:retron-type reverse transcriptase
LVRRFLRAGYIEDGSFKESLLGSPQGSVISPLLANIYLHELDRFVEGLE